MSKNIAGTDNAKIISAGKIIDDITQIENITKDIGSSYGKNRSLHSFVMLIWIVYHSKVKKTRQKKIGTREMHECISCDELTHEIPIVRCGGEEMVGIKALYCTQ